jgi:hypothetical protein
LSSYKSSLILAALLRERLTAARFIPEGVGSDSIKFTLSVDSRSMQGELLQSIADAAWTPGMASHEVQGMVNFCNKTEIILSA